MAKTTQTAPEFLTDLLNARSPSGYEGEAHKVLDTYLKPAADIYEKDALGNRIATLNPKGSPTLMLAGHMDELGLMVHYVDKDGFIYFDTIGGHDLSVISGRRVTILSEKGEITGITGKRAIHLMSAEDRKVVPELHKIWIDIGAKDKKEALSLVSIGDPVVYKDAFEPLRGTRATARAFDDKAGCYVAAETLRRIAKLKQKPTAKLVAVATSQEEIGVRGAQTAAYSVNPDIAIAIDVGHATDHPDCELTKFGETKLGGGPIFGRGPNINPIIFNKLVAAAKKLKIPYQVEAEARPTGTDARVLQMNRKGVATALISLPLRYMHTPSEMMDLEDIENAIKILVEFTISLEKGENGHW